MFKYYIRSKKFMFLSKAFLVIIFFVFIHLFKSSELIHKEISHSIIAIEINQMVYAKFIDDEFFNARDTSSSDINEEEKSDWFYYVLGIVILISAGFILKQRYEQYLKQRENL